MVPASRVVMLGATGPIFNLLLIRVLLKQEQIKYHHVIGILISFCGILLLLLFRNFENWDFSAIHFAWGDIILITGIFTTQGTVICEKRAIGLGAKPHQLVATVNIFAILLFATIVLFSAEEAQTLPAAAKAWWIFIYLVLIGAILFYYKRWVLTHVPVLFLNSLTYLERGIGIAYAAILLGEEIPLISLLGFVLVLSGSAFAIKRDLKTIPKIPTPLSQS